MKKENRAKLLEAESLIQESNFSSAKELLKELLNEDYQNIDALNDLAVVSILTENYNEATNYINRVLQIDQQNEIALENFRFLEQSGKVAIQKEEIVNSDHEKINCPFCNSMEATVYRNSADIVKCNNCDTIYLRTRLKKEKMYELYQSYADGDSHMSIPSSEEEVKSSGLRRDYFMDEILEFVEPNGNFLDIGCGWGAFLDNAKSRGFSPRGIEMTRKCVSFANEKLNIKVTNDQFEDTHFDDESLSVVSMNHVFEHLPYPLDALNKLFRVLKPGGMFCGIVPNIESYVSKQLTEEWYWLDPNFHYVHYSPKTIKKQLENAGFIVERLYTITGDYGQQNVRKEFEKTLDFTDSDFQEMLEKVEKNGEGEEIRFFARKPK